MLSNKRLPHTVYWKLLKPAVHMVCSCLSLSAPVGTKLAPNDSWSVWGRQPHREPRPRGQIKQHHFSKHFPHFKPLVIILVILQVLDNLPVLLYILALKTLLLCLGFAGVKIYQSRKAEQALKNEQEEKRRLAQRTQELLENKKDDWDAPHSVSVS